MENQNRAPNRNRNRNIELTPDQLLNSRRPPRQAIRNLGPAHPYNYLPQQNNPFIPQPQLPQRRRQDLEEQLRYNFLSKFRQNKLINLIIILMLCIYIVDLAPLCYGVYYSMTQLDLKREMQSSTLKALRSISANLRADPIMEIEIKDRGETCSSGFKILKLGAWYGTKAGCLCENGDLCETPCDKVKSEKCYKDIPSTLPLELYEWNASIWCVKRAKLGTDYLRKAECPQGWKECYSGGCFAKECPISKIDIDPNGGLSLAKAQGELPIINIQMSFGDIPCFTQDLFNQAIKNSTYELSAIKENSCDKYGLDSHFSTQLASQTAYDSFIENYFPYSAMDLPYFEGNATTTTSVLSSKVRMKTAKHDHCLNIDETPFHDFIEKISGPLIFICNSLLLIFRAMCIASIIFARAPSSMPELFYNASEKISSLHFNNILSLVGVLITLITFQSLTWSFQHLKESYEGYSSLECFVGGQGNLVINDILKALNSIGADFWVYWVLLASNVGLLYFSYPIVKKISSR